MALALNYPELETEVIEDASKDDAGSFLETFLHQLQVQSGVVKEEDVGSHPDMLIRKALKGLLDSLNNDSGSPLREVIVSLITLRKHIDATHLADLIARAVQHLFRSKQDISYLLFSEEDWRIFFSSLSPEQVLDITYMLTHKEVATHVLTRYRGLAALSSLYFQQTQTSLSVADIGCSLNFGLRASVKGNTIQKELNTLTDLTEGQFVTNLLRLRRPAINYALGIDIQPPDFEWVASCAYYSKYEETRDTLQRYRNLLHADGQNGLPIHSLVADISEPSAVHVIQSRHVKDFDIIYGSMVLYQLSRRMHEQAMANIHALLQPNGVFAELTFKNSRNWFLPWNAVTTVRFKENVTFSKPYQWLEWDNSRCMVVRPGKDFDVVNTLVQSIAKTG